MRNFRTAAVASATALTVVLGGTTLASAQTNEQEQNQEQSSAPSSSSNDQAGDAQGDNTQADDQVIFSPDQEGDKDTSSVIQDGLGGLSEGKGSSKFYDDNDKPWYAADSFGKATDAAAVPQWARDWVDGTVIAGIGAVIGLIIAAFNFASYNGLINL